MGVTTSSTVAATYEPIATQTGTGSSGTVTFNIIPQTYTDLVLVTNAMTTSSQSNALLQFNGDTSSGLYSRFALDYDLASVLKTSNTGQNYIVATADGIIGTGASTHIINIFNYTNTNTFKTVLFRNGGMTGVDLGVGLWRNTAAITSLTYYIVQNYSTSSVFTLYGIKGA